MTAEPIYCGNGKTIQLEHGTLLKFSLSPQDIEKINNWAKENKGWCNLVISKRKEMSQKGMTHYGKIDQWKPNRAEENTEESIEDISEIQTDIDEE